MADTRSKYIPPDRASASYLGEEGREGGGKMQVRATIEGNKVSIVQTRSEGTGGGGERVGKKKHGAEETRWMVSMDRSFDVLFTQTGRRMGKGGGGVFSF